MTEKRKQGGKSSQVSGKSGQPKTRSSGTSEQLDQSPFLLYGSDDDKVRVRVLLRDETIWLSLSQMAELFDVGVAAISKHLKNIYETGELERRATVSKMETVQPEGDRQVHRVRLRPVCEAEPGAGRRVVQDKAGPTGGRAMNVAREVLTHVGRLCAEVAETLALERHESFDAPRREAARLAKCGLMRKLRTGQ